MRTRQDLESYILRAGLPHEEVSENLWVLRDTANGENIVVNLAESLVIFRMKIMELKGVNDRTALFTKLLALNSSEMIHGAYGIADDALMLTCTLRINNLDYEEFVGTIDDFSLAINKHYEELSAFRAA